MKTTGLVLLLGALLTVLGCQRPKRFRTLSVSPAPTPTKDFVGQADVLEAIRNYAPIGFRKDFWRIPLRMNSPTSILGHSLSKSPCCSFNVSIRPAPPASAARSAYFLSGEEAQKQIVKLFAGTGNTGGAAAVKSFFESVYGGDEKTPPSNSRFRVETTFTHLLDAVHDWDRIQYAAVFLRLHDAEVSFTDTNQFESILRDIEVGTLTQTFTAAGKIGGKKTNYGAGATASAAVTSIPELELTPEISMSYADQLQRKLREQLNFRSASIEASGRLFRLVQRTSVENTIPSMTRQILTLDAKRKLPFTLLKTTWEKGKLTGISVESAVQPQFVGASMAEKAGDMSGQYAVKVTPVLLTAVRKIGNQKGIRTLGLDDDDRIQYDIHLDVKDRLPWPRSMYGVTRSRSRSKTTPPPKARTG